jgi:hypothetical protein
MFSKKTVIIVSLFVGIFSGCRQIPAQNVEVACADMSSSNHCPTESVERIFSSWSKDAVDASGSSFTMWTLDESNNPKSIRICVPSKWNGGASQSKAQFIQASRLAIQGKGKAPDTCKDEVSSDSVIVLDSNSSHELKASNKEINHLIAICDISTSTFGQACTPESIRTLFHKWASTYSLNTGSSFRIFVVGKDIDDAERRWFWTVPEGSAGQKIVSALSAEQEVSNIELTIGSGGSAIAESLLVASEQVAQEKGSHEFVILSDMRQVSKGKTRINFEEVVPSKKDFAKWLKQEGFMSDLHGATVKVCGVHYRQISKTHKSNANNHNAVKGVWQSTFESMGAKQITFTDECEISKQS